MFTTLRFATTMQETYAGAGFLRFEMQRSGILSAQQCSRLKCFSWSVGSSPI